LFREYGIHDPLRSRSVNDHCKASGSRRFATQMRRRCQKPRRRGLDGTCSM